MNYRNLINICIALVVLLSGLQSCKDPWENHYQAEDEAVSITLWEAIKQEPRFTAFTESMERLKLDTLFNKGLTHTIFIPDMESLGEYLDTAHNKEAIFLYHMSPTLFLSGNISNERRLQTLTSKYLIMKNINGEITVDDIPVDYVSPLYLDGKYYELNGGLILRPNLYEYTALNSDFLRKYIDSRDSVFLDLEQSTPIGFDPQGNTIYDSVFSYINRFEQDYFPVTQEFRNKSATFILFTQDQYINALDEMTSVLNITDGAAWVPEQWQLQELMPKLMKSAMYDGMLEYSDLTVGRLESITGDSVDLDYENIDPESRYLCSNGLTYLYRDFSIDNSIYLDGIMREGESVINLFGSGKWTWNEGTVTTGPSVSPIEIESGYASNGSFLNAFLPSGYTGEFTLQFTIKNVLPLRYRFVWSSNNRPSGIFAIYVNDQLLEYKDKFGRTFTEFDSFLFGDSKGILSVTGEIFKPVGPGFNKKDYWVENLNEFGEVTIRFEYKGPGAGADLGIPVGLSIDYVKLIPVV